MKLFLVNQNITSKDGFCYSRRTSLMVVFANNNSNNTKVMSISSYMKNIQSFIFYETVYCGHPVIELGNDKFSCVHLYTDIELVYIKKRPYRIFDQNLSFLNIV